MEWPESQVCSYEAAVTTLQHYSVIVLVNHEMTTKPSSPFSTFVVRIPFLSNNFLIECGVPFNEEPIRRTAHFTDIPL